MNVFRLGAPGGMTDLSTQLVRLAPPGAKVCVVELDSPDGRVQFAEEIATTIRNSRQTSMISSTVQGYQLGSITEHRTSKYHIWFIY
jgi:membrane-bound ClpP family serine protease